MKNMQPELRLSVTPKEMEMLYEGGGRRLFLKGADDSGHYSPNFFICPLIPIWELLYLEEALVPQTGTAKFEFFKTAAQYAKETRHGLKQAVLVGRGNIGALISEHHSQLEAFAGFYNGLAFGSIGALSERREGIFRRGVRGLVLDIVGQGRMHREATMAEYFSNVSRGVLSTEYADSLVAPYFRQATPALERVGQR